MKFKPHNYQQHAINFLLNHPQAALILEMGLGKTAITLTTLTHLHKTKQLGRCLIIAPLRVAQHTWPEEINKWDHTQHIDYRVAVGPKKRREEAVNQNATITIINRENIPWLVKHHGKHWPYDTVVIDELSSFKSHTSQRFKALRKVRPHISRIIGLTGTPAPNSLMDLWAQFRLLDEGKRLGGTLTSYRNTYFTPGRRNGNVIYEWHLRPGAGEAIYQQVSDITLSMKAIDHLDLPEATTLTIPVHLPAQQRREYEKLKRDLVADIAGGTIDAGNAAALSGKLQQLASGAIYANGDKEWAHLHDLKFDALDNVIESANGQPVLVAYWFKHELDRAAEKYPHARELKTEEDIRAWNAGEVPLMFIHPASAGHGLNLQDGGHILVWLTLPWSLELYEQTSARLHRQGQRAPVSIVQIITAGTVDERIVDALALKDTTQSALIDAVKAQLEAA